MRPRPDGYTIQNKNLERFLELVYLEFGTIFSHRITQAFGSKVCMSEDCRFV